MRKSLTVFVCSTYADLIEEREAVLQVIRKLQHQHDSMEFFGARTDLPIETCLEEVRRSDVLVVIVGHRYGSFVPEMGISFSEAEYREGHSLGKPCLVYLRDEDVPILPKYIERDPEKSTLLDRFKNTLQTRHTIATFKDFHDLSVCVAADLSRTAQALEDAEKDEEEELKSAIFPFEEINLIIEDALDKGIKKSSVISTIRQAIATLMRTEGVRRPLVFFSYSQKDKNIVKAVASGLQNEGIDVWIDEQEIKFGDSIVRAISKGLDSADFLAFFMSNNSLSSKWASRELDVMISRRLSKRGSAVIIPILLEDVEVPALLRDVQYLDMKDGNIDRAINNLSIAIKYNLKDRKAKE